MRSKRNVFYTSIVIAIVLISVLFSGCGYKGVFPYTQSKDQIVKVEIVDSRNNGKEYDVITEIPSDRMEEFFSDFEEIVFHKYLFGDPCEVYGTSFRIVYADDSYDIMNVIWSSFHRPGEKWSRSRSAGMHCDRSQFERLIEKWTPIEQGE